MRVLVVDNYDSFVFNLVQYLGQLGVEAQVWRNDDADLADPVSAANDFDGVLLSPGPGTPQRAGASIPLGRAGLPIHGVQFPPESILTQGGHRMLANWLAICGSAPDEALVSRLENEVADTVRAALGPTSRTSA